MFKVSMYDGCKPITVYAVDKNKDCTMFLVHNLIGNSGWEWINASLMLEPIKEVDNVTEEKMKDAMIRASNKAEITKQELFDVLTDYGLMAVYNLGMGHMYEYLKGKNNE